MFHHSLKRSGTQKLPAAAYISESESSVGSTTQLAHHSSLFPHPQLSSQYSPLSFNASYSQVSTLSHFSDAVDSTFREGRDWNPTADLINTFHDSVVEMFSSFSPLHSDFYFNYHYSEEDLLLDGDDTLSISTFSSSSTNWLSGGGQKSSNYASSIASTSSSSSNSSGIVTPPTSPEWASVKVTEVEQEEEWEDLNLEETTVHTKGKGVNLVGAFHGREQLLPLSPIKNSSIPLPPPSESISVASAQPPIRTEEAEQPRGRSRWPRILWSSNIDSDSLGVLQSYHRRAVGGDLPILGRGEQLEGRGVKEWSRKMERAGL